ncbi:MAG TPA: HYR domain-containing protein [Bacteroidetes bacterium]|nr:HYR domain-containing protein [Bacteroidota bacterium]
MKRSLLSLIQLIRAKHKHIPNLVAGIAIFLLAFPINTYTQSTVCGFTANVTSTDNQCTGSGDGAAAVNLSGGQGPFTYAWSGPGGFTSTSQNLSGLVAGNYSVTITDGVNCSEILTTTIAQIQDTTAPVLHNVPADQFVDCDAPIPADPVTATDNCNLTLLVENIVGPNECVPGLASWWPAEGNATDVQSALNTALINGTTFSGGIAGQAFSFDGVDDYIETAPTNFASNSYSVVVWINTRDSTGAAIFAATDTLNGQPGVQVTMDSAGHISFLHRAPLGTSGGTTITTSGTYNDGSWHQIAAVMGDTVQSLKVDNIFQGSQINYNNINAPTRLTIGRLSFLAQANNQNFDGLLDENRVYARALCNPEIKALYLAGIQNNTWAPTYTLTRVYTAFDNAGNFVTDYYTITVQDTTPPDLTVPAPITVQCVANGGVTRSQGGIRNWLHSANADDDCTCTVLTYTAPSFFPSDCHQGIIYTITWTAVDDCGNTITKSSTITVIDTVAPVLTCPNVTEVLPPDSCGGAFVNFTVGAQDACMTNAAPVTYSHQPGDYFPFGSTTVTAQSEDNCGNSDSCTFTVNVVDQTPPTLTCPANMQLHTSANSCSVPASWATPTATDACGMASLTSSVSLSSQFQVGTTSVTYTATDVNGNSSTCSFQVTVHDSIAPVITCPANITVFSGPNDCFAAASWTAPTASDACGIDFITSPQIGPNFPVGVTPITYAATDMNGNSSSCSFQVTVLDSTAPDLTCPANITVNTTANACAAPVNWLVPTATDACGIASVTGSQVSGSTFPVGTTTVSYTATDIHNNVSTCSFTITVSDSIPPMITCPANVSIACLADVPAADPGSIVATDNCMGVTVAHTGDTDNGGSGCGSSPLIITRTYTATDGNGNTASCTQTITVLDNVAPVITCPADVTLTCGGDTSPMATGMATATDNCANGGSACGQSITIPLATTNGGIMIDYCGFFPCNGPQPNWGTATITQTPAGITISIAMSQQVGSLWFIESLTYNAGTASSFSVNTSGIPIVNANWTTVNPPLPATQVIHIPNAQLPTDPCYAIGLSVSAVQKNFLGAVNTSSRTELWAYSTNSPNSPFLPEYCTQACTSGANVTVSSSDSFAASCGTTGIITRTWTATDACGNTSSCDQVITIQDNVAPVITCPSNVTVSNETGLCSAAATFTAMATDACGSPTIAYSHASGTSFPVGTTTVTVTATDACSNTSTCSFDVIVNDNEAPIAVCQSITLQLDANGNGSITASDINNGSTDNCGIASMSVSPTAFTCGDVGDTPVTLTVTDVNGNVSTCTAMVTIDGSNSVAITCPSDIVAACQTGDGGAVVTWNDPVAIATSTCSSNCPGNPNISGFIYLGEHDGHRYYCSNGSNYTYAQAVAGAQAAGGHVVVINDAAENAYVANAIQASDVWIGASDEVIEGQWKWTNNDPFSYLNWKAGEPNNQGGTCCANESGADHAVLKKNNGKWYDRGACGQHEYVMEITCSNPVTVTQITGAPSGSTFPEGLTVITYVASDTFGNTDTCSFTITVESTLEIICPGNIVEDCDGNGGAHVCWAEPTVLFESCDSSVCPTNTQIPGFIYLGEHDGHRYYCSNGSNYTYAQAVAGSQAAGGNVVVINNAAENQFVRNAIQANSVWIGASDENTEGQWEWINGDPFSYSHWKNGEPNNQGGACCANESGADHAVLKKNNGRWYDRGGCGHYEYVMEIPCAGYTVQQVAGPNNGSFFPSGTTTVTYIAYTATDTVSCSFDVTVEDCPIEYCEAGGQCTAYEWIKRVKIGAINNFSGNNGGYADFTALNTTVQAGSNVAIRLKPGFSGQAYREFWRVYIDWNRDGDFYDAGERVYQGRGTGTKNGTIHVPTNAASGPLRMRVMMRWDQFPGGPCCTYYYGEVEDYTIFVNGGNNRIAAGTANSNDQNQQYSAETVETAPTSGFEFHTVYPNPVSPLVNDKVSLEFRSGAAEMITISVMDLRGQVLSRVGYEAQLGANRTDVDVSRLATGTYLIELTGVSGRRTEKLIVQ